MGKRLFEFVGSDSRRGTEASAKFWETWVEDTRLFTRFGKLGSNGQTTLKEYPSREDAELAREKAISSKIKKGYVEVELAAAGAEPERWKAAGSTARWESHELFSLAQLSEFGRQLFAANSASEEFLEQLRDDPLPQVRENLARNSSTPSSILKILAEDRIDYVRLAVVENHALAPELLALLATDAEGFVRTEVARHRNTPPDILLALADDDDEYVRAGVAENPQCNAQLLQELAQDEPHVREAVARNTSAPEVLLAELAEDEDMSVRAQVAANLNASNETLAILFSDDEPYVRISAAVNLGLPKPLVRRVDHDSEEYWLRLAAAQRQDASAEALFALAHDSDEDIRRAVAANQSSAPDVLLQLVNDGDEYVRRAVAGNTSAPDSALMALASDHEEDVRQELASNPAVTGPALEVLLGKDPLLADKIAEHPNISLEIFTQTLRGQIEGPQRSPASKSRETTGRNSKPINNLPGPLAEIFQTQEPHDLDDLSLQCLFLLAFLYVGETDSRYGMTLPELEISGDVFAEHEFSRPDLWSGVYWPLDLPEPPENPDPNIFNLGPGDIGPLISPARTLFPFIELEQSDFDEQANLYFFTVYAPVNEDALALFALISNSARLKQALADSAMRRSDHWAAFRAVACLNAV